MNCVLVHRREPEYDALVECAQYDNQSSTQNVLQTAKNI